MGECAASWQKSNARAQRIARHLVVKVVGHRRLLVVTLGAQDGGARGVNNHGRRDLKRCECARVRVSE